MLREVALLQTQPPSGIAAWPEDQQDMDHITAVIQGPQDSPYASGQFKLSITVPERYPFEPPKVRFITPIYHPNIDSAGRICLDTLKMPPKGSWTPSLNLSTVLTTIQALICSPNPDDALMHDIVRFIRSCDSYDYLERSISS
jgi:ubiquitin-conjugating enzyme E2 T